MAVEQLPPVMSGAEAARACRVPERAVRRWVASGYLPALKTHPSLRIQAADLLPWLRATRAPARGRRDQPEAAPLAAAEPSTLREPAEPSLAELVSLVRDLQQQLVQASSLAMRWEERAGELGGELAASRREVAALRAALAKRDLDALRPVAAPPRPWWAFWRR
jgi:hypothetical protein